MLGVWGCHTDDRSSPSIYDINTDNHGALHVLWDLDSVEILFKLCVDLLQNIRVDCDFGPVDRLCQNKLTWDTLSIKMGLNKLLVSGIMQNNNSDGVLVEWETLQVLDVSPSISLLAIFMRNFTVERFLDPNAESTWRVPKHVVALIGLIIILLGVDYGPLFIFQVSWLSMLNSTTGILVPASLPPISKERWRVQHLPTDLVLLGFHLNFKLFELLSLHKPIDNFNNAVEALCWVRNFILLKISHFSWVRSEILRQRRLSTALDWEVNPGVTEIDEEQWLVCLFQVELVLLKQVIFHADFGNCISFFQIKEVSLWVLIPVNSVNLIRPDIVGGDDGLSGHVLVWRVEHSADLFPCFASCKLLVNPVEHRCLLNEFGGSIDIQKDSISEKAGLGQVAGPHLQVVLWDVHSFVLLEVLW